MTDPQGLANLIGNSLRAAEAAAGNGNLGQTLVELGTLHGHLGQAFLLANTIMEEAGRPPLEWDPIAGNTSAGARGGATTMSGGGNKGEPTVDNPEG